MIGLIMDGTGPARVPDHIIDALRKREDKGVIELPGVVKHEQPEWEAIMTNQVMPKWKIDTIEAAIQALQRDKVPITASRIASAQDLRYLLMRSGSTLRLTDSRIAVNDLVAPVRQRCWLRCAHSAEPPQRTTCSGSP